MIEYKNVALRYTEKDVLRDVNLQIENGEFMVLVGPSGSGKTTMIKKKVVLFKLGETWARKSITV